jgi:SAM-dependent methyltransferase
MTTGSISPARGFLAEHAHYDEDAGFWEAHADRLGGPVADLGAAAGRVAVRVALRGHEVWAVDTDPEMLEIVSRRASDAGVAPLVHPVRSSMVDAPLPAGAGLVMVPMNTLQLLRSRDEQVACLSNAASALRPGGEMVFDLAVPYFSAIRDLVGTILDTGHSMDEATGDLLLHTATFDAVDPGPGEVRLRIMVDRIHPDGGRTVVERPHHLHLYEPDEIPPIAERAGLEVIAVHGGFHGEPLDADSERHVWRLRRPDA